MKLPSSRSKTQLLLLLSLSRSQSHPNNKILQFHPPTLPHHHPKLQLPKETPLPHHLHPPQNQLHLAFHLHHHPPTPPCHKEMQPHPLLIFLAHQVPRTPPRKHMYHTNPP